MYAEELQHKRLGAVAGVFVTLALVLSVLTAIFFVAVLQARLKTYWLNIALYGALIGLAFLIVNTKLTDYIYIIEKDRITFGRRVGRREKELLFIPLRDIVSLGAYPEQIQKTRGKKRFKFTFKGKADWFVINCTKSYIIISPTQEYIERLKLARSGKTLPQADGHTDN